MTVPFTKTWHASQSQQINNGTNITPFTYTCPIFSLNTTVGATVTTPNAYDLFEAFGGLTKVQDGDIFVTQVISLYGSTQPITFSNGVGQTKIVTTNTTSFSNNLTCLVFTFSITYEQTNGAVIATYTLS